MRRRRWQFGYCRERPRRLLRGPRQDLVDVVPVELEASSVLKEVWGVLKRWTSSDGGPVD